MLGHSFVCSQQVVVTSLSVLSLIELSWQSAAEGRGDGEVGGWWRGQIKGGCQKWPKQRNSNKQKIRSTERDDKMKCVDVWQNPSPETRGCSCTKASLYLKDEIRGKQYVQIQNLMPAAKPPRLLCQRRKAGLPPRRERERERKRKEQAMRESVLRSIAMATVNSKVYAETGKCACVCLCWGSKRMDYAAERILLR